MRVAMDFHSWMRMSKKNTPSKAIATTPDGINHSSTSMPGMPTVRLQMYAPRDPAAVSKPSAHPQAFARRIPMAARIAVRKLAPNKIAM